MQRRTILLAAAGLLAAPAAVRAQSSGTGAWPNGPVRIVNPFAEPLRSQFAEVYARERAH